MEINFDTLFLMLKFAGLMIGILLGVFLIAKLTPLIAKMIDHKPERVDEKNNKNNLLEKNADDDFVVKGIYDTQDDKLNENLNEDQK